MFFIANTYPWVEVRKFNLERSYWTQHSTMCDCGLYFCRWMKILRPGSSFFQRRRNNNGETLRWNRQDLSRELTALMLPQKTNNGSEIKTICRVDASVKPIKQHELFWIPYASTHTEWQKTEKNAFFFGVEVGKERWTRIDLGLKRSCWFYWEGQVDNDAWLRSGLQLPRTT